jgi:competence protein ComEC
LSQGGAPGVQSAPVAPVSAPEAQFALADPTQSSIIVIPREELFTRPLLTIVLPARGPAALAQMLKRHWAVEVAHGRLFLLLPVFLGLGVIFWFTVERDPPLWLPALGLPLLFAGLTLGRQRRSVLRYGIIGLALVLCGMGLAAIETLRHGTVVLDSPVTTRIEGIVERREAAGEGRWRYEILLTSTERPMLARQPHHIAVLARGQTVPVEPGQRIRGLARLSPPSGPALPGLSDFAFASYFDDIGAIGYFYGKPATGEAMEARRFGEDLRVGLFALRGAIGDRIRSIVPGDAGAFAAAIVTDERRAISRDTLEALRLSGLAHIVAISGLNMALAAGIFFVGVRTLLSLCGGFAQRFAIKKIAAAGALLMATAYYLISGFGVSAERAYLMMAIMLIAVFFDRPSISLHNVALAALVILIMSPSAVLGASFQMSFSATAALIAGYAAWMAYRSHAQDDARLPQAGLVGTLVGLVIGTLAGTAMTSLIGGLSTAIFSASHFHQLTGYGLIANLATMPLIALVVMPCGLVGMLLMPFGLDAPFFHLMGQGLELVIAVARLVASWGGELSTGRPHPWFLAIAVTGFLILVLSHTRLRLLGLPLLALAFGLFALPGQGPSRRLVIAEDGGMAALVEARTAAVNRRKPPDFVYRQWQNALRVAKTVPPRERKPAELGLDAGEARQGAPLDGSENAASDVRRARQPLTAAQRHSAATAFNSLLDGQHAGRFACIAGIGCFTRAQEGIVVAVIEDARYAGTACDMADIVVAGSVRFETCRSGALMFNGPTLRRTGAIEIDFGGSRDKTLWRATGAMHGVDRPWTQGRAYDWRSRGFDRTLPEPIRLLLDRERR